MSKAEELYNQKRYAFSLDEAVEHAKEAAERLARRVEKGEIMCEKCAIEHYALYRWLVELLECRQEDEEVSDFLKGCNHGVNE